MSDQFTFEVNGKTLKTGNKLPDTMPLSFNGLPKTRKHTLEYIAERAKNPNLVPVNDPTHGFGKIVEWFNQGGLSSCNAYMIAWIICVLIWRQTAKKVRLSPEWVYMLINGGRDQGSMLDDGMVAMFEPDQDGNVGMPKFDQRFYEKHRMDQVSMEDKRRAKQSAKDHCFQECYQADASTFENMIMDMLSTLADGGCCGTAVHVKKKYFDNCGVDDGPGNHAVAVVSYRLLTPRPKSIEDFEFLSPQTWGEGFAENGFGWLNYRHFYQPGARHAFYCVTAASAIIKVLKECRIIN